VTLILFRDNIEILGITRLAEWDVLTFLYRHGTSLASAEQIARLVGYSSAEVGAALESLNSIGLIQRSHNCHGVRAYQLAPALPGDSRRQCFEDLMKLAEDRQGRLLIVTNLRPSSIERSLRGRRGLHRA
jgi:DNA-binding MarR family transcriptional regulator